MAKQIRKILAVALAIALCMMQMVIPVFAGSTEVHIKVENIGEIGGNKDSVTIIVTDKDGNEYTYDATIKGGQLSFDMGDDDNGFYVAPGESLDVGFVNNENGASGTITVTQKEGNGTHIDKEHDKGTNNFNGVANAPATEPEAPTTQPTEPEAPTTKPTEPEAPTTKPTEPEAPITKPTEPETPTTKPTEPEIPGTEPPTEKEEDDFEPVLNIEKTADKEVYQIGETITWTITVTNTSEFTAYAIVITDELVDETWTITSLAPGASAEFTATMEAEEAGELTNVVVVDWTDNDDLNDADEDEITSDSDEITVEVEKPIEEPTEEEEEETTTETTDPEEEEPTAPDTEEPTENEEPAPAPQNPPAQNPPAQNQQPQAQPQQQPQQQVPQAGAMLVDIFDEDVPLADVPETGDISLLWLAMSILSGTGAVALKRKED